MAAIYRPRYEPYIPTRLWPVLFAIKPIPNVSSLLFFAPTRPRRQEPYDPRPSWVALLQSEELPPEKGRQSTLRDFAPTRPRRQEPYDPRILWATLFAIEPVPNISDLTFFSPTRPRRQEPYDPRQSWTPLFPPGPGPVSPGGCAPGSITWKAKKTPMKRPFAFVKRP